MRNRRPERNSGYTSTNALVLKNPPGDARRAFVPRLFQVESGGGFTAVGRARHRDRSGVRSIGEQGAEDDDRLDVQLVDQLEQILAETAPPHVGLDPAKQDDVALAARRRTDRQTCCRPNDFASDTVDLPDCGAVDLIVVVVL